MKIKFTHDTNVELVTQLDSNQEPVYESELFLAGYIQDDLELLAETPETVDLQFGDGSCVYQLPRTSFTVLS